jgi:hypothetical protein
MLDPLKPIADIYGKIHDSVVDWNDQAPISNNISSVTEEIIEILSEVDGMTQANSRDFKRATPLFTLRDGSVLKTWKNPVGVNHVFIGNSNGEMMFGGYVGWIHADGLTEAINRIKREYK